MPDRSQFWLEELPLELIRQIALHMDPWALRSLLKASPRICACFILLVGNTIRFRHAYGTPRFFVVDGLRWMSRNHFQPGSNKALVKIYEVYILEDMSGMAMVLDHVSPSDSYVLCMGSSNTTEFHMYRYIDRIVKEAGVPYWRDYIALGPPIMPPPRVIGQSGIITDAIRNLDVDHIICLQDVSFRGVTRLKLMFGQPGDGSRPQLKRVVARKVSEISIYYHDSPPLFIDVRLGEEDNSPLGILELCHVPSQRCDLGGPLPVYPSTEEELDFSAICHRPIAGVRVVGGHDAIITQLDLSETGALYWRQTHCQNKLVTALPSAPYLEEFAFESFLPDATVPTLSHDTVSALSVVAHDGLVMRSNDIPLETWEWLLIHCGGTRPGRAVPSLAMLAPRVTSPTRIIPKLSLRGLRRPRLGSPGVERFVRRLIRGYYSSQTDIS